jgi:hypothetical protein
MLRIRYRRGTRKGDSMRRLQFAMPRTRLLRPAIFCALLIALAFVSPRGCELLSSSGEPGEVPPAQVGLTPGD